MTHVVARSKAQMKSIINSKTAKEQILKACETAIDNCAYQHNGNLEMIIPQNVKTKPGSIENSQPVKVKITFEYFWDAQKQSNLICTPFFYLYETILNEIDYIIDISDMNACKRFFFNFLMQHKDNPAAIDLLLNKFPQYKELADTILLLK